MTSQTALTGVWVYAFTRFHQREPGSALSRANAKTTRDASTPCAAPHRNYTPVNPTRECKLSEKDAPAR